ncbi:mechanosensitive ion channel domain-containing protein [Rhodocaloribacter sp.]
MPALILAACDTDEPAPEAPRSTVAVAPDTLALAPDTLALGTPVADSTLAASPADTALASPRAALDSLRREIEGLRALVTAPPPALPADTSRAAADTLSVGDRLRDTAQGLQFVGFRIFWAVLVLILTFFVIKGVVRLLETLAEQSATRRLFFKKLIPIIRLFTWSAAIYYVIAGVFRVNQGQLLAASAAIGVAIGFAAQDVLKNIFGGLLIILDQPFQVGDKIRVGGTYGEVVSIGLRSTRIVTLDDSLVSVPNAQVVDGQVANANAGALDCQVVTDLYLPGWIDVKAAKAIAYQAAATSRYVYLDKPVVVLVKDEFKETFLTHLVVKAYVLDARYESVFASEVTETAKAEFLRRGMLRPLGHDVFTEPFELPDESPGEAPPAGEGTS